MKRALKSLNHALSGFSHALQRERNLQLFLMGYIVVIILGAFLHLKPDEWLAIILSGGLFMAMELLNTALERFVDVFDEYRKIIKPSDTHHLGLKLTKDVASAASLVSLIVVVCVVLIVFVPHMIG